MESEQQENNTARMGMRLLCPQWVAGKNKGEVLTYNYALKSIIQGKVQYYDLSEAKFSSQIPQWIPKFYPSRLLHYGDFFDSFSTLLLFRLR